MLTCSPPNSLVIAAHNMVGAEAHLCTAGRGVSAPTVLAHRLVHCKAACELIQVRVSGTRASCSLDPKLEGISATH
jgi:hypothetical protein